MLLYHDFGFPGGPLGAIGAPPGSFLGRPGPPRWSFWAPAIGFLDKQAFGHQPTVPSCTETWKTAVTK